MNEQINEARDTLSHCLWQGRTLAANTAQPVARWVNIKTARTKLLTAIAKNNTIYDKNITANHAPKMVHQVKTQHCSSAGFLPNLRVEIIPIASQSTFEKSSQRG